MDKKTMGMVLKVLGFAVMLYFVLIPIITIAVEISLSIPAPILALIFPGNPKHDFAVGLMIAMVCAPLLLYFGYKFRGQLPVE